jgi:tetratricopeptide (TPR) repeat protein
MSQAFQSPTRQQLAQLRRNVAEHFNESELRTLCFDLEVDYDELPGRAKSEKAAELVAHLERRGRLPELVELGKQLRPKLAWEYAPGAPGRVRGFSSRRLVWIGLAAALAVFGGAAWFFSRPPLVPRPTDIPTPCQPAALPVEMGVTWTANCPADLAPQLAQEWKAGGAQVTLLGQAAPLSLRTTDRPGPDLVAQLTCTLASEAMQVTFDLARSRIPDEVYQPPSLSVQGTVTAVVDTGLVLISFQGGDYVSATSQFTQLANTRTDPDQALLWANSLLFQGQYPKAMEAYGQVLALCPRSGAAYNNLGVAGINQERVHDASSLLMLQNFEQAVDLAETDEVKLLALVNRSDLYLWNNRVEEAKVDCGKALDLDPRSPLAHLCLANYYFYFVGSPAGFQSKAVEEQLTQARENNGEALPSYHFVRAAWLSQKDQQKTLDAWLGRKEIRQETVISCREYLRLMEHRACLATHQKQIGEARSLLDSITR